MIQVSSGYYLISAAIQKVQGAKPFFKKHGAIAPQPPLLLCLCMLYLLLVI